MNTRQSLCVCASLVAILYPIVVSAAVIRILPASRTANAGDLVQLAAVVDSEGVAINNAEADIVYPADKLDFVSASKSGSIFTLWINEPTLTNAGDVNFNGGVPTPGYTGGAGQIVSLIFRARAAGTAVVAPKNAAVRANDGQGTDVLRGTESASVTINAPQTGATSLPAASQESLLPGSDSTSVSGANVAGGPALQLSSRTHPDPSAWYSNPNPTVDWVLPQGTDAVQTLVSSQRGKQPTVLYEPPIATRSIQDLPDGVWYFNARARENGAWGAIASYALRIDTTPPVIRSAEVSYDAAAGTLLVGIDADDAVSGIAKYDISVDGTILKTVMPDDIGKLPLSVPYVISGDHSALILVTDKAGNNVGASRTFTVPSIEAPVVAPISGDVATGDPVLITGTAASSSQMVVVHLIHEGGVDEQMQAQAKEDGTYSVTTSPLKRGAYAVFAEAVSPGGIKSAKSAQQQFRVKDAVILGTESLGITLPQAIIVLLILAFASFVMSLIALLIALSDHPYVNRMRERTRAMRVQSRRDERG